MDRETELLNTDEADLECSAGENPQRTWRIRGPVTTALAIVAGSSAVLALSYAGLSTHTTRFVPAGLVGLSTKFKFDDAGSGKCVSKSGQDPDYKYFHQVGEDDCLKLCDQSMACFGYSVSRHGNCIVWEQVGIKGGGPEWGDARCQLKNMDALKGKFYDSGPGKCLTDDGKDPEHDYQHDKADECKKLCQDDDDCYGYSASDDGNCLKWMEEGIKGGGPDWGSASCFVKIV